MQILKRLDDALIAIAQEIYLWLWDRTGVYVATVMFSMNVVDVIVRREVGLAAIMFIGLMAAMLFAWHQGQTTGNATINEMTRSWRDSIWRRLCLAMQVGIFIADLISFDMGRALGFFFAVGWIYVACSQVRDREPPEARSMAPQST